MNKKQLLIQALVIITLLIFAWPVHAQSNVEVKLTPTQNQLTVGDPVELILEVTHPEGYQVIIPKLEQNWGSFEVRDQSQTTTTANGDGSATTRQTITVTLFELGTFETPALPLTVTDETNQVIEELVPPVSLSVTPTLPEEQTTLNDIRPQAEMDLPSLLPAILAGTIVVLALAGGGWLLYRRWQGKPLFGHVDNRPPYQRALDELGRIDSLGLVAQGQFKEHYTQTTDCLRRYLEEQFNLDIFDRTTAELKPILRQSALDGEYARAFGDFFSDSDFVKFTDLDPDAKEAKTLTNRARVLVNSTKPVVKNSKSDNFEQTFGADKPQKPVEASA